VEEWNASKKVFSQNEGFRKIEEEGGRFQFQDSKQIEKHIHHGQALLAHSPM
jgi:hypothetical protein